jgi:glycosyltransferase involved in cell wall biosynthesis
VTSPNRPLLCVLGLRGIPGVMGGVETHCEELLPRIAASAPDLDIEVVARRPYISEPTSVGAVRVTPQFSTRSQTTEALSSTIIGLFYARRRRARAVHIHAVGPALLAPVARLLGMKVIFTHHGADYDRQKWGAIAKGMLRLGEWVGVRFATAVIVVAPSLAEQLKARFPSQAGRIRYVPNGRTAAAASAESASILKGLDVESSGYVLTVGRLVPEKGFHLLIDAIERSGSGKKLVIVGGAQHETQYSRELLSRSSSQIIFAGVQDRATLQTLYENAELFVLPSFHEGLPISALEAGSAGCPLLLSDIPGNRDLGLSPTHYFRCGDGEDLVRALREPPQSYAVSPEDFLRFDWDEIAAGTLAIYDMAIGQFAERRLSASA